VESYDINSKTMWFENCQYQSVPSALFAQFIYNMSMSQTFF